MRVEIQNMKLLKKIGKAKIVRNGINLSLIENKYIPIDNEILTFGIIGRITAQKNPKLFNEIALLFPRYKFIWIGDGELRDEITAPNIEITGWLFNSDQVYSQLNKIDVFLQTSLWEGLPIAILEGAVFRKPIVATNVIGNKDVVVNGVNGFLFNDIDSLKESFLLLEDKIFREEMGLNSYEIVKEKFDNQKNFYELIKIYKT